MVRATPHLTPSCNAEKTAPPLIYDNSALARRHINLLPAAKSRKQAGGGRGSSGRFTTVQAAPMWEHSKACLIDFSLSKISESSVDGGEARTRMRRRRAGRGGRALEENQFFFFPFGLNWDGHTMWNLPTFVPFTLRVRKMDCVGAFTHPAEGCVQLR